MLATSAGRCPLQSTHSASILVFPHSWAQVYACAWSFQNRSLHPPDPHFQWTLTDVASGRKDPQKGSNGTSCSLGPHGPSSHGSHCYRNVCAWRNASIPRYAPDLKIKSISPPWVGSPLSCNLWACPHELCSGACPSGQSLLKCHQSIFNSTELITKSVPASSLIIFEILI